MKYIISQILFAEFILALYYTFTFIKKNPLRFRENRLFFIVCFSSAIWSLGFYGVHIQTIPDNAYMWRAIGMVGTFGYLIAAQLLVCSLSGIKKIFQYIIRAFSYLGILLYFFVIQKDQVTYEPTSIGMSYSFNPGIWNNIYTTFSVLTGVIMFAVIIYMIRCSPTKRQRIVGRKFLVAVVAIFVGMIFDTLLPMFNIKSIPGSTISQFIGLSVLYSTIIFVNHSRINIGNMSEFVYYSLTVPVLVYDSNKKLKILNDTAYSFLGVPGEDFEIEGIESLFKHESKDVFNFEGKSQDVDAICNNNNLYCSLSINKIYDDYNDLIGYILIVTDLSERMKSMKKLEEAMILAEQANQAKSIFLANMSHEIRTPMNVILGFTELILKKNIDLVVRHHVEDIKYSSHNLLAIINDILDISKIESGKKELVCDTYYTGSFLSDISLIITPQAEKKNLDFNMKVDKNIPKALYGDKTRIRSILVNILNNAVKYTQSGNIIFEISVLNKTPTHVTMEFKISDTGIGIRNEDIENLFKSFERLDKKINHEIEGSGLGLSIANEYITLMGGSINVESTYQHGSTFTIVFDQEIVDPSPLDNDFAHKDSASSTGSISDMKINGLRVLVTDDNAINLSVASGILDYYGLMVDTAESAQESIELCKQYAYDFVFMDQMMPNMDGIEAMKHIRSISPHYDKGGKCKIIVLTADAIKGTREALIEKGFDEYLGKPINFNQLENLFRRYVSPDLITYEVANSETESDIDSRLTFLKNTLSDVNVEIGINNCGGELDDYLKVLKITYDHGAKQLKEMYDLWKKDDYEQYIIKIHSVKSTTMNIGATIISDMARKQEERGRLGDTIYIDSHVDDFQNEYKELLDNVKLVLEHFDMLHTEELITEEELDPVIIRQILNNISRCIDNFNFNKIFDILEETKKYKLSDKDQILFARISELMEDLSVDEILELINEAQE